MIDNEEKVRVAMRAFMDQFKAEISNETGRGKDLIRCFEGIIPKVMLKITDFNNKQKIKMIANLIGILNERHENGVIMAIAALIGCITSLEPEFDKHIEEMVQEIEDNPTEGEE